MVSHLVRVIVLGNLPGGEKWTVTPTFDSITGDDVSYADCLNLVGAINAITVPTGLRNQWNVNTGIAGVRVEAREYNGTLQAQAEGMRSSPVNGSSSKNLPYQAAIVSSLRTALPGPRGRGRLYWPGTGADIDPSSLRLSPTNANLFLTGVASYLSAMRTEINTVLGSPNVLAVWSRENQEATVVNRLLVGDILDVQRRRRDSLSETYASTSF
jgi:hypothetical protein